MFYCYNLTRLNVMLMVWDAKKHHQRLKNRAFFMTIKQILLQILILISVMCENLNM